VPIDSAQLPSPDEAKWVMPSALQPSHAKLITLRPFVFKLPSFGFEYPAQQDVLLSLVWSQVPVIQVLLGQFGLVTSSQMFSQWKFVVVGATVAAAVLTPSTDPFTQVRSMIATVSWLPPPSKTAYAVGPLHLASSGLRWPSTTIRTGGCTPS